MNATAQNPMPQPVGNGTDIDLPEGWTAVTLPDICEINPPKPRSDELPPNAQVTFVPMPAVDAEMGAITAPAIRSFSEVRKGFTAFREGDVIFAKITPCMENGKSAIARNLKNGLGFGSTEFHVLRPTNAVLAEFIYHFVRQEAYRRAAESEMTGSVGQKRVPADFLKKTEFPLPPLAEQKRIVEQVEELVSRLDASHNRLAEVPKILKRFRQAVLAAAYSGRLTEDWKKRHPMMRSAEELLDNVRRLRRKYWESLKSAHHRKGHYPESIEIDTTDLPDIPEDWLWTSADELCSQITDGEHVQPKYQEKGFPMLTATHVRDGYVEFKNVGLIGKADFDNCLKRCAPIKDDVLIVSVGATTGRAAIVEDCQPFAIVRSVLLLRPLIVPRFLLRWAQSPWCQFWISQASGASAQPHFYIHDNKRMPVPLPPLVEQHEIVRRVEALFRLADTIEKRVEAATKRAEKLTQAILAKAFRGELVSTEAELARREGRYYESAAVLLRRIKGTSAA